MVQVDAFFTEHGGYFSVITVTSVDAILTCVILVCFSGDDDGGTGDWFNSSTRLILEELVDGGTRSVISSKWTSTLQESRLGWAAEL
jgi:hypothetical protein